MAILLTNGKYYIAHGKSGAVIKVSDIDKAQNFYSVERAIAQKNKTPGKCAGYYFIDTDKNENVCSEKKSVKTRRKIFSTQERIRIYGKTQGHCYLCGEFVPFELFEVEHCIPLSKGGTNSMDNLFPSCHCCNAIKKDIYLEEFMWKISRIFMHQMEARYRGEEEWEVVHMLLDRMA